MTIFQFFKKNKVFLLKIYITLVFIFFLITSIINIIYMIIYKKYFYSITLFYLMCMVIITFISEISPYLLFKYIIKILPSFQNYSGRMWTYLIVGFIYLSPELNLDNVFKESNQNNMNYFPLSDYFDFSFYNGVFMIITGVFCYLINNILSINRKIQENQLLVMSKNYNDFENIMTNRISLFYQQK